MGMCLSLRGAAVYLAAVAAAAFALPLTAQQPTVGEQASWLDRPTLTGNWNALRTEIEKKGITLRAHFVTESAGNPIGGKSHTVRYTQQIDFGADLDLGQMVDDQGGKIQITFTDRKGRSLSADAIGNLFAVQQLYGAGQNFRLAELNYQQNLFGERLVIELGWSPAGDYFASLPVFCDFQNGFICGHPNPMTTNSGAHNSPVGQWGARLKVKPSRQYYIQAGLYQLNPHAGDADSGFDLSFSSTGVLVPLEFGWLPGKGTGQSPGIYKIGAYYNSTPTSDVLTDMDGLSAGLTGAPFAVRNGRWGTYLLADQVVERDGPNARHFLRVGAIGGVADRATAMYQYFVAAGGVRQ